MLKGDNFVCLFFHKNKPMVDIFWTGILPQLCKQHKFLGNIPVVQKCNKETKRWPKTRSRTCYGDLDVIAFCLMSTRCNKKHELLEKSSSGSRNHQRNTLKPSAPEIRSMQQGTGKAVLVLNHLAFALYYSFIHGFKKRHSHRLICKPT